ncbi:hypothetical protein [Catenulispora rubra]|nr:hypothetical protein [Catenulispora rubra]
MAETTTVTELELAPVEESNEISEAELEDITGGAYAPTCTNAVCCVNQ